MEDECFEILEHTRDRAANNMYCGDSDEMRFLVNWGLMKYAGTTGFCKDPYYTITEFGLKILKKVESERCQEKDTTQAKF